MKRIIVAVALIAAGSNVVAGPLSMAFHTSNKKSATPVASKEDAKVKAEIEARIAAVTKGASQVTASEEKQEVKKPGFLSRLYRGARRHTKKVAFGVTSLVAATALALDSEKCGKPVEASMPAWTPNVVKNHIGQGYVTSPIVSAWEKRPGFLGGKASEVKADGNDEN